MPIIYMKKFKVGILGATGMVGQKFITLLQNHPWFDIEVLAASERSAGKPFKEAVKNRRHMDKSIPKSLENKIIMDVQKDIENIVSKVDFVFCAVNMPKQELKKLEEDYAKMECPVISNNSANRMATDVPMIIPEINANHMEVIPFQRKRLKTKRGFIAVKSNCSIQCYVPALHPFFKNNIEKI